MEPWHYSRPTDPNLCLHIETRDEKNTARRAARLRFVQYSWIGKNVENIEKFASEKPRQSTVIAVIARTEPQIRSFYRLHSSSDLPKELMPFMFMVRWTDDAILRSVSPFSIKIVG